MNYIGYSKVIITVNAFFIDICRLYVFFYFPQMHTSNALAKIL